MVTGFEIYGAIGTSIALLNLARQAYESLAKTYSDYSKAGPNILATQGKCSVMYFRVQTWCNIWGLDKPMTVEMCKAYWGEDGWNEIERQIAVVSIKCADLAAIIDKVLPDTALANISEDDRKQIRACLEQRTSSTRPMHWKWIRRVVDPRVPVPWINTEQRVEEIHLLEKRIHNSTSTRKKIKYVLSLSENLQKHLKALEEDFDALTRLTDTAWQSQHPKVDHKTSTLNERHLAALTKANIFLLQEAKEDRLATKALYSCCSTTQQALKLELSLLDMTGESRCKRFQIFVPRPQYREHLEVSTVMLRKDPPSDDADWRDNFLDACDRARQQGEGLLWIPSDDLNGSAGPLQQLRRKSCFMLRKRAMHVKELDLSRLSVQMGSLVAAERLELAYSVVETGLILLGTSWLSALSNTALKRLRANQQPPRYVLEINDRSNLVRTRLWDLRKHLHLYIFTIGITLVEIALRTIVRDLRPFNSELQLFLEGSEGVKWHSLSHVVTLVKENFGAAYCEAVEFCLQDPKHAPNRHWNRGCFYDTSYSEEQVSVQLLDPFYNNVVVKLEP